jgi:hypothetical protein
MGVHFVLPCLSAVGNSPLTCTSVHSTSGIPVPLQHTSEWAITYSAKTFALMHNAERQGKTRKATDIKIIIKHIPDNRTIR